MTGADLLHRRETLGLSRDQFADAIYEHPDQIAEWEGIRGRLPSGLSGRLELALENTERLIAIRAAGAEVCPWVEGRLAGATAGDPKDLQRRLVDVKLHRESCPVCRLPERTNAQLLAPGVIISTGTARIALPPDRATLNIAIETHAPTASQATLTNGRRQQAVLEALERLGYGADQARAAGFSVIPQYDIGRPGIVVDYQARLDIVVTVDDLDRLSVTVDGALAAGTTEIKNVVFMSDSLPASRTSALVEAVASARGDAEALASAAGGHLGRLLELSTVQTSANRVVLAGAATPPKEAPAAVGANDVPIEITVHARWEFRPS